MNIKKLNEELEQFLDSSNNGEDILHELTQQGFKEFFCMVDDDAGNSFECSSLQELESTLDDYCIGYSYEIYNSNEWERTDERLMNIGSWEGTVEYEDMSLYGGEPSYHMTRDERFDSIILLLDVSNGTETVLDYLQRKADSNEI